MTKYLHFIGMLVLVCSSCKCRQNNEERNQKFCQNELILLSLDSVSPITNYSLVDFRENVWEKFDSVFDEFYCRQVKLKVDFIIENNDTLKLLLYSSNMVNCDFKPHEVPPPFNPFVHWIHIYITKYDTVWIRRKTSAINSVEEAVIQRYKELSVDKYAFVNIALLWDHETDKEKLTGLIEDCINGYLEVASNLCLNLFGKQICELNDLELKLLSEKIPFKLRTDFWDHVPDNFEFVPFDIPPPPSEL